MPTATAFKDIFDIPEWRPLGVAPAASIGGSSLAYDERPNELRHPEIFFQSSAALLYKYSLKNDSWWQLASPALTGTFTVGATNIFAPSAGPQGTVAAGASTTQIALTTALPAAVGINQLANRGDGQGFTIRIIGNSAGGSGLTQERQIVANTAGTTPTITLSSALSFTPASGDRYEILSGRVFMLSAGLLAAGCWKWYDIATNSFGGNLSIVNLPATVATGSSALATDEAYVPYTRNPGEGYLVDTKTYDANHTFPNQTAAALGCLQATASAATSLTGQATAGDAAVVANEYRNFQVRIVEDTATPTSVGQRRNITSHTAGASPVYTVAAWTVTPSATCKFVIEHNTDRIVLFTSGVTTTYTYSISGDAWNTATFGARTNAVGAGVCAWLPFGIVKDAQGLSLPGQIISVRGAATSEIDILDITAAAAGTWTNVLTYGNLGLTTFTSGTSAAYMGAVGSGRYAYIQPNVNANLVRFDCLNHVMEAYSQLRYADGAAVEGQHLATTVFVDGAVRLGFVFKQRQTGAELFENLITR